MESKENNTKCCSSVPSGNLLTPMSNAIARLFPAMPRHASVNQRQLCHAH